MSKLMKIPVSRQLAAAAIVALLPLSALAQLSWDCGDYGSGNYGPWDYTNPQHYAEKLPVVERAHFTSSVESLTRGNTSHDPVDDIDYTLRKFPNHHRALHALARYYLRDSQVKPGRRRPDCYFELAMRWRPDDGMVRMIYGIFLHRRGDLQQARQRYEESLERMPDSAEPHYNLGLLLFEIKDYDGALEQARMAYGRGYPLPGLRNKLERAGVWSEPAETPDRTVAEGPRDAE